LTCRKPVFAVRRENKENNMPNAAAGIIEADNHVADETVPAADREVLRALAGRVAELAARPIELEKRRLWTALNELRSRRPMVFCDPENGWNEIILQSDLGCRSPLGRAWEWVLRRDAFWGEEMGDDRVIQPWFDLGYVYTRTGWGMVEESIGGQDGGARTWIAPLKDLDDLSALRPQTINVDRPATQRRLSLAGEIFGDLLPARMRTSWFNGWYWSLGMTLDVIHLRGLGQMMLDMYDNPAGLHRLMAFLRDSYLAMVEFLEREHLYTLNNEGDYVGSAGFGWTSQLPAPGFSGQARTRDLWVLLESQETVGVSPAMFEEFVLAYQLPIMERFGLVCYGCCEPVHARWAPLSRVKNLRRVSVSPWCDRAAMAENLGNRYVYSLKTHPGLLAAPSFDEDAIRADLRDALARARGCHLEIIMKDNNTIARDPDRVKRWCRIAREEIDRA
jgi:hypothetical protein